MLAVLAYCRKDTAQALSLLRWMTELDGLKTSHELLLVAAAELPEAVLKQAAAAARQTFASVTTIKPSRSVETGWPGACNHLFRTAATYVLKSGRWEYFQWIEPDCIQLVAGAFDRTESAYLAAGKPFLGHTVHEPVNHLPGNAIYPADIKRYNPFIMQPVRQGIKELAWDCIHPELTLKHTAHSQLFQHVWVQKGAATPQTFPDLKSLSILRKDAVFFHRNKDHSLVLRLREQRARVSQPTLVERVKEWVRPATTTVVGSSMTTSKSDYQDMASPPRSKASSQRPLIHTYFEKLLGFPDQAPLIELWLRRWSEQGWNPVVLGEKDAKKGSRGLYPRLLNTIMKLPTCNHREYENACYMRHLAMANRSGGLLVDYDVMPLDFTPARAESTLPCQALQLLEPTRVPCAVWGVGDKGYLQVVQAFLDYKVDPATDLYQGKPHVSDMEILRKTSLPRASLCVEYLCSGSSQPNDPGDGWRRASMIHFSSASLGLRGRDATEKVKVIEEVLAELKSDVPLPA